MQNCTYFADQPFHFTKYSILPCQKIRTENSHLGKLYGANQHENDEISTVEFLTFLVRFLRIHSAAKMPSTGGELSLFSSADLTSAISPYTSIVSAGNSIFTWPEGIRISLIVHPVILTKTITNYVMARGPMAGC